MTLASCAMMSGMRRMRRSIDFISYFQLLITKFYFFKWVLPWARRAGEYREIILGLERGWLAERM